MTKRITYRDMCEVAQDLTPEGVSHIGSETNIQEYCRNGNTINTLEWCLSNGGTLTVKPVLDGMSAHVSVIDAQGKTTATMIMNEDYYRTWELEIFGSNSVPSHLVPEIKW